MSGLDRSTFRPLRRCLRWLFIILTLRPCLSLLKLIGSGTAGVQIPNSKFQIPKAEVQIPKSEVLKSEVQILKSEVQIPESEVQVIVRGSILNQPSDCC